MTRHPVLFLVGLHGSGKTTLGRLLKDRHGWRQLSVGDLGRLARRNKLPQGVSLRLMLTLAQATPGKHIDDAAVALLLAQIDAWRRDTPVAVDGFPSLPAHLLRTPDRAGVVHVECARAICEPRLMLRSEKTQRKWTPALPARVTSRSPSSYRTRAPSRTFARSTMTAALTTSKQRPTNSTPGRRSLHRAKKSAALQKR